MRSLTLDAAMLVSLSVFLFNGCSQSKSMPTEIKVGDSINSARSALELWGGRGVHLSLYTVTVPPLSASSEDSLDRSHRVSESRTDESGFGQPPEAFQLEVVDPSELPFDGYMFGNRTIVLHGESTVSDIEIITSDGGGKSTDVSVYGHQRLTKAELLK